MRLMNTRARAATPLALAGLVTLPLALAACGYQPSLGDYRPVVDSYNTDMAAYEADRGQCVAVAMQAQAEYERQQRLKRESNMTIGLIVGAIAGAAVGSVSGDAGDGAVVGGTLGALEGGLAETDYDPVTSPRKIVDRLHEEAQLRDPQRPRQGGVRGSSIST